MPLSVGGFAIFSDGYFLSTNMITKVCKYLYLCSFFDIYKLGYYTEHVPIQTIYLKCVHLLSTCSSSHADTVLFIDLRENIPYGFSASREKNANLNFIFIYRSTLRILR